MKKDEINRLNKYLSDMFNEKKLTIVPDNKNKNQAVVAVNKEFFAKLEKIEDEGEISYDFSKDIPDQPIDELNQYFKKLFKDKNMEVRQRPKGEAYFKELLEQGKDESEVKQSDSADIYKGKELIGVLFDNESEGMQVFNMAILDIDLEDIDEE